MRALRITVALLVLASLPPAAARALVTAVNPVKDSGINASQGTSCQQTAGSAQNMFVGTTCGKGNCADHRSLLHFDVSAIPSSALVASASLNFNVEALFGSSVKLKMFRLTQSAWTESGVTYGSYDCPAGLTWITPGGDFSSVNRVTWRATSAGGSAIDISALVQDAVDTRGGQVHIIMKAGRRFSADRYINISTRESAQPPLLLVVWVPATPTVTNTVTPTPTITLTPSSPPTATRPPGVPPPLGQWSPIGPAPFLLPDGRKNAGIVGEIAIGTAAGGGAPRLWAATSLGLQYSDDAADPGVPCDQVHWSPAGSTLAAGPVNNVLLSPWDGGVVYASIGGLNDPSLNPVKGWYRSSDNGASWETWNGNLVALLDAGSPIDVGRRAVIARQPGAPGTDVLYSFVGAVPTVCSDGTPAMPARLFKTTSSVK